MVFKRKQIVVLSLVLMVVIAGYLSYTNKGSVLVSEKDSNKIGEAVYVDSEQVAKDDQTGQKEQTDQKEKKTQKATSVSKATGDYFTQARLDRDMARGRENESLKAITEDKNAAKDEKAKAFDQMMKTVETSDKEMKLETLLKQKGFKDIFAMFGEDGSVDIVVKAPNLTSAQVAQIADITSRQAKVQMKDIHISNKY